VVHEFSLLKLFLHRTPLECPMCQRSVYKHGTPPEWRILQEALKHIEH